VSNGEFEFHDTSNQFLVHFDAHSNRLVMLSTGGGITRAEALNLAAWIVALVDPKQMDFFRLLTAIQNS
jgi:hypothetical protein